MSQTNTRGRLARVSRLAGIGATIHVGTALLLLATPTPPGPGLVGSWRSLWIAPTALVVTGALACTAHLLLFLTLRGIARRLAAGEPAASLAGALATKEEAWAEMRRAAVGPAVLVGWAIAVPLASRDTVGWPGVLTLVGAAPGLAWALTGLVGGGPLPMTDRLISRLRGGSVGILVAGLAVVISSGSLAVASSLPLLLATRIPESGPTESAPSVASTLTFTPHPGNGPAATRAGESIHALFFVGSRRPDDPRELSPRRTYDPWWPLDAPPTLPFPPHTWGDNLAGAIRRGELTGAHLAILERLAAHPANHEFDQLTGVRTADITGTRWRPLSDGPISVFELPVPRYVEMWNGVRSRIAGAMLAYATGDLAEARRRLDGVVDLGTLLVRDGPLVLDGLLGAEIAAEGMRAIQSIDPESPPPRRSPAPAAAVADRRPPPITRPSERWEWVRGYAALSGQMDHPKGTRLHALSVVATFIPCSGPSSVLWGPRPGQKAWLAGAVEALARRPSDEELAHVLTHGYVGTRAGIHGWGWLPQSLAVVLGSRPAVTHCASMAAVVLG